LVRPIIMPYYLIRGNGYSHFACY